MKLPVAEAPPVAQAPPVAEAPPRYLPAGEAALVVEFGQTIDPAIHDRVLALDAAIAGAGIEGVVETVPTFRSVMVHFDPRRLAADELAARLAALKPEPAAVLGKPKRWRIPVCYDLPHAEDLAEVAQKLSLPPERIVALHSDAEYRVYMYGFSPGFTFLGGLSPELDISRRATPRPPAPTGSLLIAGGQALITSFVMPTGWYNLGRTPVRTFDPRRERAFLAGVGDHVLFERIDAATFDALSADAEGGALIAREEP